MQCPECQTEMRPGTCLIHSRPWALLFFGVSTQSGCESTQTCLSMVNEDIPADVPTDTVGGCLSFLPDTWDAGTLDLGVCLGPPDIGSPDVGVCLQPPFDAGTDSVGPCLDPPYDAGTDHVGPCLDIDPDAAGCLSDLGPADVGPCLDMVPDAGALQRRVIVG